jgi:hypothetical protein
MRDIDVRQALRLEMNRLHLQDLDTRIVEELGLCQGIARVDLAVVNGSFHGYEIKSESDTLARLPGQITVYNSVLDFVTIVAASSHIDKVVRIVPPWWGMWAVSNDCGINLNELRKPRRNPRIDPFALAQLLWRGEALEALSEFGLIAGNRSKPRGELWRLLASELKVEQLGEIVRTRLKVRGASWRPPAPQV